MTTQLNAEAMAPVEALDLLIARHGLVRVVLALPVALFQRRNTRLNLTHGLSHHLMRDIGLDHPPGPKQYWEQR